MSWKLLRNIIRGIWPPRERLPLTYDPIDGFNRPPEPGETIPGVEAKPVPGIWQRRQRLKAEDFTGKVVAHSPDVWFELARESVVARRACREARFEGKVIFEPRSGSIEVRHPAKDGPVVWAGNIAEFHLKD